MTTRYGEVVNTPEHNAAASLFLSSIPLDTKSKQHHVYRSLSENPSSSSDNGFWGFQEHLNIQKFNSYSYIPLLSSRRPVKISNEIKREDVDRRVLFTFNKASLLCVFSVLPYQNNYSLSNLPIVTPIERNNSGNFAQTVSYAHLLEDAEENTAVQQYDPFNLDKLDQDNINKTDIVLDSMIVSYLEFKLFDSLKKDANDQFKERWPEVNITFSKIKSIKRDLLKAANELKLPIMVLCYSYAYFETLCFSVFINKSNRKLAAGACMILAAKFLHCSHGNMLDLLEEILRAPKQHILQQEFKVLSALRFSLAYPASKIMYHYKKIVGNALD